MRKRLALAVAVAAALVACAPPVSRSDYGTITIGIVGQSVRGLASGWPDGEAPSLTSVKVVVSASDMGTVSAIVTKPAGTISIQVPSGSGRIVRVFATPTPGQVVPVFAKAYAGSATVDVKEGTAVPVAIRLALGETKILIPDLGGGVFRTADSLAGPVSGAGIPYAPGFVSYALDNYGRLYLPSLTGFTRYPDLSEAAGETIPLPDFYPGEIQGMAYSSADARLYYVSSVGEAEFNLYYIDILADSPSPTSVDLPPKYPVEDGWGMFPPLAADRSGHVYLTVFQSTTGAYELLKLAVAAPSGGSAQSAAVQRIANQTFGAQYQEEGGIVVGIFAEEDAVYLAVLYQTTEESAASRGKVVALDASTFNMDWETGLSPEAFPTYPDSQFYGPVCFVGFAPGKLYVGDEGYVDDGGEGTTEIHRIVEVNTVTHSISAVGLQDVATFLFGEGVR